MGDKLFLEGLFNSHYLINKKIYVIRQFLHDFLSELKQFYRVYNATKVTTTSSSADMVRLYVNAQFQVKPLITGTSSNRTKTSIFEKKIGST